VALCPNCRAFWVKNTRCGCGFMEVKELISLNQYFGENPYNDELHRAADDLLLKVNSLLQELGIESVTMTSGYRTVAHNASIGGAANSKHCFAQAIDLEDNDRIIYGRIKGNLNRLQARGCAIEDPRYCEKADGTKWTHIQSVLPASGRTIFIPYAGPIIKK